MFLPLVNKSVQTVVQHISGTNDFFVFIPLKPNELALNHFTRLFVKKEAFRA